MSRKFVSFLSAGLLLAAHAFSMPGYSINGGISTAQMTLSAVGVSPCVPVISLVNYKTAAPPFLQPALLAFVSSGASLTYSVEVTGDDVLAPNYVSANGNFVAFTNMGGLTVSATATLGAAVTCVRLHVTSYTSGNVFLEVVQQTVN